MRDRLRRKNESTIPIINDDHDGKINPLMEKLMDESMKTRRKTAADKQAQRKFMRLSARRFDRLLDIGARLRPARG